MEREFLRGGKIPNDPGPRNIRKCRPSQRPRVIRGFLYGCEVTNTRGNTDNHGRKANGWAGRTPWVIRRLLGCFKELNRRCANDLDKVPSVWRRVVRLFLCGSNVPNNACPCDVG